MFLFVNMYMINSEKIDIDISVIFHLLNIF